LSFASCYVLKSTRKTETMKVLTPLTLPLHVKSSNSLGILVGHRYCLSELYVGILALKVDHYVNWQLSFDEWAGTHGSKSYFECTIAENVRSFQQQCLRLLHAL